MEFPFVFIRENGSRVVLKVVATNLEEAIESVQEQHPDLYEEAESVLPC